MNTAALDSTAQAARKLDILLHLLANLQRPLLLQGERGRGKTALLRGLQAQAHPSWIVCYVAANANLTLNHLIEEMLRALRVPSHGLSDAEMASVLSERLSLLTRNGKSLVLALDDCAVLMPGLLAGVYQFSRQHPGLKLIAAMRPEEVAGKNLTDGLLFSDVYVMRLSGQAAPMTVRQEQNLLVASKTHFLSPRTALLLAGSLLVLIVAAIAYMAGRKEDPIGAVPPPVASPEKSPASIAQPGARIEAPALVQAPSPLVDEPPRATPAPSLPAPSEPSSQGGEAGQETPPAAKLEVSTKTAPPLAESNAPRPSASTQIQAAAQNPAPISAATPAPTIETKKEAPPAPPPSVAPEAPATAPVKSEEKPKQKPEQQKPAKPSLPLGNEVGALKDAGWLLAQDPNAFTLQLVAVSRLESLTDFLRRVPTSEQVATFRSSKGLGDLYPLFYGLYPSLAAAKEAVAALPASLGRPIPRQLSSIHREIRRTAPANVDTAILPNP